MALMGNLTNTNEYNTMLSHQSSSAPSQQYIQLQQLQNQHLQHLQQHQQPPPPVDDYEMKVRKFLEMTRDEDNVEDTVRRFIEEASKHQKDRKETEEKTRKRKKKDIKKSKKELKKKKKEKKSKRKGSDTMEEVENAKLREALK